MLIHGSLYGLSILKLAGMILIVLTMVLLIAFSKQLSTSLVIFSILSISLALSFCYELLSSYPLGEDVHYEYLTVKAKTLGVNIENKALAPPDYYYEVLNYISSTAILSNLLGVDVIYIMKYFWGSLILGLVPLIVYMYVYRCTSGEKIHSIIACFLIVSQSSYITALHSTLKQALSFFMLSLIMLVLVVQLKGDRRYSNVFTLVILMLGLTGYHYLSSGLFSFILLLSIPLLLVVSLLPRRSRIALEGSSGGNTVIVSVTLFMVWVIWYLIVFGELVPAVMDLIKRLVSMTPPGYYYEKVYVSLPAILNGIRLLINGVIVLTVFVSGILAFIRLIRHEDPFSPLILLSSLLFLITTVLELIGISTLGIGRLSIMLLALISPYFYYALNSIMSIFSKKNAYIVLFVIFLLTTRIAISTGLLPYIFRDYENSIVFDPSYAIETSVSLEGVKSAEYITSFIDHDLSYKVGLDFRSRRYFVYATEGYSLTLDYNYFRHLYRDEYYSYIVVYLSPFNLVKNIVQVRVDAFKPLDEYLHVLFNSCSQIYYSTKSGVFTLEDLRLRIDYAGKKGEL
jgi:uncharacterized membrane protein